MATPHGAPATPAAENGLSVRGFTMATVKLPILKAGPIDALARDLGITPPEMIFGDNLAQISHAASGWSITFTARDALDLVDKTGENMFRVAYSDAWQQNRQKQIQGSGITDVVRPFDWSYSTDYKGTVAGPALQPTTTQIPLALLRRPDPILFFDELVLYEDELADNGIAVLSCKIRVMPERVLLLLRFFMRLDDVVFRIRDTRVFIEFATGQVIREYTAREEKYEVVKGKIPGRKEDVLAVMRDANRLVEYMPVVEQVLEAVKLET